MNRISVNRFGHIYWNDHRVSDAAFTKLLEQARKLDPEPGFYLETEMGLPCRDLEEVRDRMNTVLDCDGEPGRCQEGLPDPTTRKFLP